MSSSLSAEFFVESYDVFDRQLASQYRLSFVMLFVSFESSPSFDESDASRLASHHHYLASFQAKFYEIFCCLRSFRMVYPTVRPPCLASSTSLQHLPFFLLRCRCLGSRRATMGRCSAADAGRRRPPRSSSGATSARTSSAPSVM